MASDEKDNEDYNSASDEDFNPDIPKHAINDNGSGDGESTSDEEEEEGEEGEGSAVGKPVKRMKNKRDEQEAEDIGFENSGDEATISKGLKKRKRKGGSGNWDNSDEDEGGEGGLIKTRAQRRTEKQEKKPLANASDATVDVNALWAQMSQDHSATKNDSTLAITRSSDLTASQHLDRAASNIDPPLSRNQPTPLPIASQGAPKQELNDCAAAGTKMITIKRTYEFAGQKKEEERIVPADSAEARLYLEEQSRSLPVKQSGPTKPGVRRPMKRKSIFDTSNSLSSNSRSFGPSKDKKLNTLQKSQLDWAAHVDQEGLNEELDEHQRAKGTYLGRMDFLGRMDAKREEDIRNSSAKK